MYLFLMVKIVSNVSTCLLVYFQLDLLLLLQNSVLTSFIIATTLFLADLYSFQSCSLLVFFYIFLFILKCKKQIHIGPINWLIHNCSLSQPKLDAVLISHCPLICQLKRGDITMNSLTKWFGTWILIVQGFGRYHISWNLLEERELNIRFMILLSNPIYIYFTEFVVCNFFFK